MGFAPQFVDIDADGYKDLISGDWVGQIILFRGQADGSFAPGKPINDANGEPIKVDYGVAAFAHDWDADGDLDLFAGTVDGSGDGNVYLLKNDGAPTLPKFGMPQRLTAAGRTIVAPDGDAGPVVADWDGDGKPDLLLGCGDGSVLWYRNVGTDREPQLSEAQVLIHAPEPRDERGVRSKICVTDWNADGRLDLVLGDHGSLFEKALDKAELEWRNQAKERQEEALAKWAEVFAEYRKLLQAESTDQDHKAKIETVRAELMTLNKLRNRNYLEEQALSPGMQSHGRVWVYLRRE